MKTMARKPVLTKKDFRVRYQTGEFGNRCPSWLTLEDFLASGYSEPVHIRNGAIAGGDGKYDVPADEASEVWYKYARKYGESGLYIGAMGPPNRFREVQGEVSRDAWGLRLLYTTVQLPMREALIRESKEVSGIIASSVLNYYLWGRDLDWLHYLLDAYPDHVVEFSTYSICWGTVPNYHTIYWEVRKY